MHFALLIQNRILNWWVRLLLTAGLAPPTYALLETTGRRSGRLRQIPVANGLQGDTFWLVAALGEHARTHATSKPSLGFESRPVQPGCATDCECAGAPAPRVRYTTMTLAPDNNSSALGALATEPTDSYSEPLPPSRGASC